MLCAKRQQNPSRRKRVIVLTRSAADSHKRPDVEFSHRIFRFSLPGRENPEQTVSCQDDNSLPPGTILLSLRTQHETPLMPPCAQWYHPDSFLSDLPTRYTQTSPIAPRAQPPDAPSPLRGAKCRHLDGPTPRSLSRFRLDRMRPNIAGSWGHSQCSALSRRHFPKMYF